MKKVTLTCISDPNRSTAINFVDVNGRSLYIVDWRMVVVEGGKCPTPREKRGGIVREGNVRAICPEEYVVTKTSGKAVGNWELAQR